jgi:predicted dinucleotide-binding enzyme
MYSNARPSRTTMPIAGNDPAAKNIVTEFLQTVG